MPKVKCKKKHVQRAAGPSAGPSAVAECYSGQQDSEDSDDFPDDNSMEDEELLFPPLIIRKSTESAAGPVNWDEDDDEDDDELENVLQEVDGDNGDQPGDSISIEERIRRERCYEELGFRAPTVVLRQPFPQGANNFFEVQDIDDSLNSTTDTMNDPDIAFGPGPKNHKRETHRRIKQEKWAREAPDFVELMRDLAKLRNKHVISKAAITDVSKAFLGNLDRLKRVIEQMSQKNCRIPAPDAFSIMQTALVGLPKPIIVTGVQDVATQEMKVIIQQTYPRQFLRLHPTLDPVYEYTMLKVEEVVKVHCDKATVGMAPQEFDTSIDGVALDKSGLHSVKICSIRFVDCNKIFPVSIYRQFKKKENCKDSRVTSDAILFRVLRDGLRAGLRYRFNNVDGIMHADLKGLVFPTGYCCCPWCERDGVGRRKGDDDGLAGRGSVLYPHDDKVYPLRTHNASLDLIYKAELWKAAKSKASPDLKQAMEEKRPLRGWKRRSLLLNIQDFDIITSFGFDSMHAVFGGAFRRIMNELFIVARSGTLTNKKRGSAKAPNTGTLTHRMPSSVLKDVLRKLKVPREFTRKPQEPHAGTKMAEYRNYLCVMVPVIVTVVDDKAMQSLLWLMMYCIRAVLMDDDEYAKLRADKELIPLEIVFQLFSKAYTKLLGKEACTSVFHLFSHLMLCRERGCLFCQSCFPFENSYGLFRRMFSPGTYSVGKQIMEGVLLRNLAGHTCSPPEIRLSAQTSARGDDTLVYTSEGMFRLKFVPKDDPSFVRGVKIETLAAPVDIKFDADIATCCLRMDKVGVFFYCEDSDEEVELFVRDIKGKCVYLPGAVDNYIVTVSKKFLNES